MTEQHQRATVCLPGCSVVKNQPANAGNASSIPRLGRSPGEGNGNPLKYSCLENPKDRGTWQATVQGFTNSHSGDLPNPGIEPRSLVFQVDSLPAEPPGKPKNTGMDSLSLLQGIFPTQESNRCLLHCRQILYQLSYQESPDTNKLQSINQYTQSIRIDIKEKTF